MNFMFMFELKLGIAIFEVFRAVVDIRGQHHASRGARGKLLSRPPTPGDNFEPTPQPSKTDGAECSIPCGKRDCPIVRFSYSNNLLGIHILDSVLQIRNK